MSYEGYEMFVCTNGHKWSMSGQFYYIHTEFDDEISCPHCHAKIAWHCSVDQTNGDCKPPELEVLDPKTCECCGQSKGPVVYKIPGPEVKAVYVETNEDDIVVAQPINDGEEVF